MTHRWSGRELTLSGCYATHLGDTLCMTPLPRLLSVAYGTRVYLSDEPIHRAVFANNPYVAGFRKTRGIRLHHRLRGSGHLLQRFQRRFGLLVEGVPRPELYLSDAEIQWAIGQRKKWPVDRPTCILSTRAIAEASRYRNIDWPAIGAAWLEFCTLVQPVMSSPAVYQNEIVKPSGEHRNSWRPAEVVPGAIIYRDLALRQYISLFHVADHFCGGSSGGSHVAAAFGLPSLIVIWPEIFQTLRFPQRSRGFSEDMFLYPQHGFINMADVRSGRVNRAVLAKHISSVRSRKAAGRDTGADIASAQDACARITILPWPRRTLIRTRKGRIISLPRGSEKKEHRHPPHLIGTLERISAEKRQ